MLCNSIIIEICINKVPMNMKFDLILKVKKKIKYCSKAFNLIIFYLLIVNYNQF